MSLLLLTKVIIYSIKFQCISGGLVLLDSFPHGYRDLLEKEALAELATIMADGSLQVTPVWFNEKDGFLLVNSAKGRQKDLNIRRNPKVGLCIIDPDNPYRYIEVRGIVTEITEEGADMHIDQLSQKYMGVDEYPFRQDQERRVIYKIMPERINTYG